MKQFILFISLLCFIVDCSVGQQQNNSFQTNNDSIHSAMHYYLLAVKALKDKEQLEAMNYYEMARRCKDYSSESDTFHVIDNVRAMQKQEIDSLKLSNGLINASQIALQSLNSGNTDEKARLALSSLNSFYGLPKDLRDSTDVFSISNTLNALHDAFNLIYKPEYKFDGNVQFVHQLTDTTSWIVDTNGEIYLVSFNQNGLNEKPQLIMKLNSMLVKDLAYNDKFKAFAGASASRRNKIVLYDDADNHKAFDVPKELRIINSIAFINDTLIFGGSDHTIYKVHFTTSVKCLYEFETSPSCFVASGDHLYIGTKDGRIFEWDPDTKKSCVFSQHAQEGALSRIALINDPRGKVYLLAGFADGTVRRFCSDGSSIKYSSQHRDYITEILPVVPQNYLVKMSVDGRVSLTRLFENQGIQESIVLSYNNVNLPMGISYSTKYNCLYVFCRNGNLDVLHLDPNYYRMFLEEYYKAFMDKDQIKVRHE